MSDSNVCHFSQFRAISYGLFGKEDYHRAVRRKAVKYMSEHKPDFEAFLGESFKSYMKEMAQTSSWGDELTLVSYCMIVPLSLLESAFIEPPLPPSKSYTNTSPQLSAGETTFLKFT